MSYQPGQAVEIDYTNYEGRRSRRIVTPNGRMEFTENQWHTPPQWIFYAWDHAKGAERGFSYLGLHAVRPATAEEVKAAEAEATALA